LNQEAGLAKEWVSSKVQAEDDLTEKLNVKLYSLHVHLSVVFFVLTDFKAA
jgi:hypothetical protein